MAFEVIEMVCQSCPVQRNTPYQGWVLQGRINMMHLYTIIIKYSEYLLSIYYSIISTYLYMKVSHISMQSFSVPQYKSHILFFKIPKVLYGFQAHCNHSLIHTTIYGGIIYILYYCKYISVYEDFSYFYVEFQCTSAQIL